MSEAEGPLGIGIVTNLSHMYHLKLATRTTWCPLAVPQKYKFGSGLWQVAGDRGGAGQPQLSHQRNIHREQVGWPQETEWKK